MKSFSKVLIIRIWHHENLNLKYNILGPHQQVYENHFFSASMTIHSQVMDKRGNLKSPKSSNFNYPLQLCQVVDFCFVVNFHVKGVPNFCQQSHQHMNMCP